MKFLKSNVIINVSSKAISFSEWRMSLGGDKKIRRKPVRRKFMKKIWQKSLASMVSAALCLTAFVGCLTVNAATTYRGKITSKGVEVEATAKEATIDLVVLATVPAEAKGMACAGLKVTTGYGKLTNAEVTSGNAYVETKVINGETDKPTEIPDIGADGQFIVTANDTKTGVNSFNVRLTFTAGNDVTAGTTYPVNVTYLGSKDIGAGNWDEDAFTFDVSGVNGITVNSGVYEATDLKFRSAGITLANGFALDFRVRKTMETDLGYSDIYVTFQKPRYNADGSLAETRSTTVVASSRTEDPNNSENFVYTLTGIQPQELATQITATIYGTKDGHVYTGVTITYSALKFATSMITSANQSAKMKTACADMINFAAAIQSYAKYNTANPIADKATELVQSDSWKSLATETVSRELVSASSNKKLEGATTRIRSAGVTFEDKVILYFNCADAGTATTLTNPENYVLRTTYTSVTGKPRVKDSEIDSNYQARLDTLYSTELGTVVSASVVEKATGKIVSNSITYSIESFIKTKSTDPSLGELCIALLKYGDSVRALAGLN